MRTVRLGVGVSVTAQAGHGHGASLIDGSRTPAGFIPIPTTASTFEPEVGTSAFVGLAGICAGGRPELRQRAIPTATDGPLNGSG